MRLQIRRSANPTLVRLAAADPRHCPSKQFPHIFGREMTQSGHRYRTVNAPDVRFPIDVQSKGAVSVSNGPQKLEHRLAIDRMERSLRANNAETINGSVGWSQVRVLAGSSGEATVGRTALDEEVDHIVEDFVAEPMAEQLGGVQDPVDQPGATAVQTLVGAAQPMDGRLDVTDVLRAIDDGQRGVQADQLFEAIEALGDQRFDGDLYRSRKNKGLFKNSFLIIS